MIDNKTINPAAAKTGGIAVTVFMYIILIITAIWVIYPMAFTVSSAFTEANSLSATNILPLPMKPVRDENGQQVRDADGRAVRKVHFSIYQFRRLLTPSDQLVVDPNVTGAASANTKGTSYVRWYANTLKIAIMNTLATLAVCVTSGYIFSRFRFKARKPLMASMIVLQMFPSFIGMVATYVILMRINGLNTHWGLILVYVSGSIPYNTWIMKGYFDTVSKNVEEAARVDGANQLTTYLWIIVPIVKPMIMFLALTSFTGPWMDFIFPRLVLRSDDKKTLAVGLWELINGRAADNYTMFAAGALLIAVPFTILFMAGQKFLLHSLAGDGVKE